MKVKRRTTIIVVIIVVILVAVLAITRWQRAVATQKLLKELPGDDYSKIEDAMTQLKERGRSIVPALLGLLQDRSSDAARWRAASLLGDVGTRAAHEPLLAALKDPAPEVRTAAALSLGRLKVKTAVQPLMGLLADNKEKPSVRIAAAQALGLIGDPTASKPLRDALADRLEALQAAAAAADKAVTDAETALKTAREDLAKATADKLEAARKAVEEKEKALADARKAAEKPRAALAAAAKAAPAGPQPPAAPAAPSKPGTAAEPPPLPTDTLWELRAAAARALGMAGDDSAAITLTESLDTMKEPNVEVRVAAAYALGDLARRARKRDTQTAIINGLLRVLDKASDEKVGDVKAAAIWSLQFVSAPTHLEARVEEALKRSAEDDFYWAREAARSSAKALNIQIAEQ